MLFHVQHLPSFTAMKSSAKFYGRPSFSNNAACVCFLKMISTLINSARWWFQIFFMFTPIWANDPIWLIFFNWVETTNQMISTLINSAILSLKTKAKKKKLLHHGGKTSKAHLSLPAQIVDGLYKASDDAGLHLRSNALRCLEMETVVSGFWSTL